MLTDFYELTMANGYFENGFENTMENFNACKKLLNRLNKIEKLKLQNRAYRYQHSVKKLLRY